MDTKTEAQTLVTRLIKEANLSPNDIAHLLNGRISSRTVYRWGKGESYPQNTSDFNALVDLVKTKLGETGEVSVES